MMLWKSVEARIPIPVLAAMFMVASAALFATNMGIIRVVTAELHPLVVAVFRNVFATMFMLPWLLRNSSLLRTKRPGLQIVRAFIQVLTMTTGFTAIAIMPLAEVTSVMFTAPIMVGMGAVVLLGETMGVRRWSAAAIGLVGALIILRPGFDNSGWETAVAVSAAVTWAALTLSMKVLTRDDSVGTIVAMNLVLTTPLALIGALFFWTWPSLETTLWMVAQGGIGVLGQLAITRAMSLGEASYVITFDFLRLPFAALIGYFVFAEVMDSLTLLGSLVILGSTGYFMHRERLAQRRSRSQDTSR